MFQSAFYSDLSAPTLSSNAQSDSSGVTLSRKGSFARFLTFGWSRRASDDYRRLNPHLLRDIGMDGL